MTMAAAIAGMTRVEPAIEADIVVRREVTVNERLRICPFGWSPDG